MDTVVSIYLVLGIGQRVVYQLARELSSGRVITRAKHTEATCASLVIGSLAIYLSIYLSNHL